MTNVARNRTLPPPFGFGEGRRERQLSGGSDVMRRFCRWEFFRHSSFVIRHFALFFLLSFAASAASPSHPNIIFILMDDLRWDEMDYPFVKALNVQRIARE